MDVNQPILSQYPPDGSKYIDPLYVPYQRTNVSLGGEGCYHPTNSWVKQGSPAMFSKDHVRKGWNMDFQLLHPNDSCPPGYGKTEGGFCTKIHEQSNDSNFYTDNEYTVKYQYHDGYTINPKDRISAAKLERMDTAPTFQTRSVNPHTGKYVVYFDNNPNKVYEKYGRNPARHSYLGL